jgi:hypothetical protein
MRAPRSVRARVVNMREMVSAGAGRRSIQLRPGLKYLRPFSSARGTTASPPVIPGGMRRLRVGMAGTMPPSPRWPCGRGSSAGRRRLGRSRDDGGFELLAGARSALGQDAKGRRPLVRARQGLGLIWSSRFPLRPGTGGEPVGFRALGSGAADRGRSRPPSFQRITRSAYFHLCWRFAVLC